MERHRSAGQSDGDAQCPVEPRHPDKGDEVGHQSERQLDGRISDHLRRDMVAIPIARVDQDDDDKDDNDKDDKDDKNDKDDKDDDND